MAKSQIKTVLGLPFSILDFIYGLNINLEYRNFDLTMFFGREWGLISM
ncbi:MAG: hypothetical protein ACLUHA_11705 [Bacteroides stercoris]